MQPLAIDTETDLYRSGYMVPDLICLSFYGPGVPAGVVDAREAEDVFTAALHGHITAHYAAFDMSVLGRAFPHLLPSIFQAYQENRVTCTLLRQQLIDIAAGEYRWLKKNPGYSLASLSKRLLAQTLDKSWQIEYWKLKHTPIQEWPEAAREYPRLDAQTAGSLWALEEGQGAGFLEDQYRQARADFWIRLMTSWGARTDAKGVGEFARLTQTSYDEVASELRAAGLLRPDTPKAPGSRNTKAAQQRIVLAYEFIGKPCPLTDGGQPALDSVACNDSGDPLLVRYAELSGLKSVLSKDVKLLRSGVNEPIHSRFGLAESGRTTSSDPNLQNLRRLPGVRECFVPSRPGWVFIASDFGQLELFTLAEVCFSVIGFSALGEMLNQGLDPHLIIASDISGIPYDELVRRRKTLPHNDPLYHEMDQLRQVGKVANFGFPGGLGAESLCWFALEQYGVRMVQDQQPGPGVHPGAKQLKRIWLNRLPEMRHYFQWIDQQVNANPPMARQLFSNRFRGRMGYTDCCNTYFQGLGADIAKAAGWEITKAQFLPGGPLWGFRTVLFTHDEFVSEGPEHRAHEAALEQSRLMVEAAKPWLPHMVPIKAPPEMMRRYSKEAKAIYENRRLVPWDL